MDISQIDKNFQITYSYEGMTTYNINEAPFCIYGNCRQEGETGFQRLPDSLVEQLKDNPGIPFLYKNTSGIRVRFRTDSKRITLGCVLPQIHHSNTLPLSGSSCFDLYADGEYCMSLHPGRSVTGGYSSNATMGDHGYHSGYTFRDSKTREILIHFPLYNDVSQVFIALEDGSSLLPTAGYRDLLPVVFYGSSITQGGCASHPGNNFPAIISRRLDVDFVNLGFSGGCFAEPEMADYIAGLPMSALVFDYDHNAPSADFLSNTHEPFYKKIRQLRPDLPIILASKADLCMGEEATEQRRSVILQTYHNAIAAGDRNIYFVDGKEIYKEVGHSFCTVDNTHPNDLGFWCMANAYEPVIASALHLS